MNLGALFIDYFKQKFKQNMFKGVLPAYKQVSLLKMSNLHMGGLNEYLPKCEFKDSGGKAKNEFYSNKQDRSLLL